METLCEENLLTGGAAGRRGGGKPDDPAEASDDNDGDGRPSLFQTGTVGKGWEEAGSCFEVTGSRGTWGGGTSRSATAAAATNGEGEGKTDTTNGRSEPRLELGSLLDGVDVVGVAFSKVKRSMLVTAHASTAQREPGDGSVAGLGGARGELRPVLEGCGVVCVWNVENVTVREWERVGLGGRGGEGVLISCFALIISPLTTQPVRDGLESYSYRGDKGDLYQVCAIK